MLTIRPQQLNTFQQAALKNFEDEMVDHLRRFAPRLCEAAGEQGVRSAIQMGVERAARYGLDQRGPVTFYLEMMFSFGAEFDTDPQYPWAAQALAGMWIGGQDARVNALYKSMDEYTDKVAGPQNENAIAALSRLSQTSTDDFKGLPGTLQARVAAALNRIYPQKAEYLGPAVLQALVYRASGMASQYSLPPDAGAGLMAGLMFAFGHGAATDPLYPWITAALTDPLTKDGQGRVEHLHSKARLYAQRAQDHLTKA